MYYNKASEGPLFAPSDASHSSDLGLALGVLFLRLVSTRGTRVPLKQTIHTDNLKVFPSVKVVSGLVSSVAHPWHNRDSILTVFRIPVHPGTDP